MKVSMTGKKTDIWTPFQVRVWALCRRVKANQITTYGDIASCLSSSARAVGTALRRNPLAPTVPCHRVVRTDLGVGGFRGASHPDSPHVLRKIKILESEGIIFDPKTRKISRVCQRIHYDTPPTPAEVASIQRLLAHTGGPQKRT